MRALNDLGDAICILCIRTCDTHQIEAGVNCFVGPFIAATFVENEATWNARTFGGDLAQASIEMKPLSGATLRIAQKIAVETDDDRRVRLFRGIERSLQGR